MDPHPLHQRGDMEAAGLEALGGQQIAQHAVARERKVEMQFIHPPHQREVGGQGWPWQVLDAAPADIQRPGFLAAALRSKHSGRPVQKLCLPLGESG